MRKIFVLIALIWYASSADSTAQVIVKVRPTPPKNIVVKPAKVYKNKVWIEGHWKWNKQTRDYRWVKGHWAKKRPRSVWVTGKWQKVPAGWKYIPGHWSRQRS